MTDERLYNECCCDNSQTKHASLQPVLKHISTSKTQHISANKTRHKVIKSVLEKLSFSMVGINEGSFAKFLDLLAQHNQVFYEEVVVERCGCLLDQADCDDNSVDNSVIFNCLQDQAESDDNSVDNSVMINCMQDQAKFDDTSVDTSVIINLASVGAMSATNEDDSDMASICAIRGYAKGTLDVRADDSPREVPEARRSSAVGRSRSRPARTKSQWEEVETTSVVDTTRACIHRQLRSSHHGVLKTRIISRLDMQDVSLKH